MEINKNQQKVTALVGFVRKSKKAFRCGTAERLFVKWPDLLLGGFVAVFACVRLFKMAEFLACAAEPHIDVLDRLADLCSDFLHAGSGFSGSVKDRGDLLFELALRSAWACGFGSFRAGFATAFGFFSTEHANGLASFAGG